MNLAYRGEQMGLEWMKTIQPAIESCFLVLHGTDSKDDRLAAIFKVLFITVILNLIFDAYKVQDTVRDDL